eukprot:TRINITY_DN1520_c0_g1_i10.p1 TRINITY_DN1520_c0_g1~~TRINITY_DN1520_c0_g1_i10.p1  ORF type:complete len:617 (-),score=164.86 TRINITY_DN1520_c0_g1_i10:543-2393(-)
MLTDSPLAQSNTESSSEECPTKFNTNSCEEDDDVINNPAPPSSLPLHHGRGGGAPHGGGGVRAPLPHTEVPWGVTTGPGGEGGLNPQQLVNVLNAAAGGGGGGAQVQFRLDSSTGIVKLKSYEKTGQHPSCPLCWRHKQIFHCQSCIAAGDYVHSKAKLYVRFADHKLKLCALQRDIKESKVQIEEKIRESVHKKKLREDIRQLKNKIKQMRHVIKSKRERKAITDQNLAKLNTSNTRRHQRLPEYVAKVEKIRLCVERFKVDLQAKRSHCCNTVIQLNQLRSELVSYLSDIFPIEEVYPVSSERSDVMLDFLAEAMATSYIHGRWVSVEQSGEMQYRVVAPMLACSGDYTPIYALIATNKEGVAASMGVEPQPALNIAAGLSLLAQYVRLISTFSGVPMPIKLNPADFGIIETSEFKFSVKVAKLNLWVVALCLALGVDSREIRPVQTVHNVLLLVEHIKSTQLSPIGQNSNLTQSDLEQSFTEFGYFEPVAPEMSVSVWEQVIHRENQELRHLEEETSRGGPGSGAGGAGAAGGDPSPWGHEDDTKDWDNDDDAFNEWESVGAEDVNMAVLSSSPSSAMAMASEAGHAASSLSFVSSTVSSLLWGITSPKSPRK